MTELPDGEQWEVLPPIAFWRLRCEICKTLIDDRITSRDTAVRLGKEHSKQQHPEYFEFRVQGVALTRNRPTRSR